MSSDLTSKIQKLIENEIGYVPRLQHIKETITNGKKLYDLDKKYLDSLVLKYFINNEFSKVNEGNPEDNESTNDTEDKIQ